MMYDFCFGSTNKLGLRKMVDKFSVSILSYYYIIIIIILLLLLETMTT